MRAVLTRVKHASVSIDGKETARIGEGFLILLGVTHEDTEAQAVKLAEKLTASFLRMKPANEPWPDGRRRRGADRLAVHAHGNCVSGRRPEFLSAARPEVAIPLYEKFVQLCRDKRLHVETGEFGAYMQVESLNDGPVTLIVDTDNL